MPLEVITPINEGATATLEFLFKDQDGTAIPVANIATAKMTFTLEGTNQIINARELVDVRLNFNTQGLFSFGLTPSDNVFLSTGAGVEYEYHLLTFQIATTGVNSIIYNEEIRLKIMNLQTVRPTYVRPPAVSAIVRTVDSTVAVG